MERNERVCLLHSIASRIILHCLHFVARGLLRRGAPRNMSQGFVYIITNKHNTTLYVGMTSMLYTRTKKHREKFYPKSFSARYNLSKLVYFEVLESTAAARERELQLKAGSRRRKMALIDQYNPEWRDLFEVISNENWDGAGSSQFSAALNYVIP